MGSVSLNEGFGNGTIINECVDCCVWLFLSCMMSRMVLPDCWLREEASSVGQSDDSPHLHRIVFSFLFVLAFLLFGYDR